MYDLIDRPVRALTAQARFMLWAMRGWAQAAANGQCPPHALQSGFGGGEGRPALFDFHQAMSFFNRHAANRLSLAPLGCTRVVEADVCRSMSMAAARLALCGIDLSDITASEEGMAHDE